MITSGRCRRMAGGGRRWSSSPVLVRVLCGARARVHALRRFRRSASHAVGDHKFSIVEIDDTAKMMLVAFDERSMLGDAEELSDDNGNVLYSRQRKYRTAFIQEAFLDDMTEDLNAIKDSAAEEDAATATASGPPRPRSPRRSRARRWCRSRLA